MVMQGTMYLRPGPVQRAVKWGVSYLQRLVPIYLLSLIMGMHGYGGDARLDEGMTYQQMNAVLHAGPTAFVRAIFR